ncbi:hypothetical protein OAK44_00740, partial [bacterium]|nr:hypothetical protein [bacterium]
MRKIGVKVVFPVAIKDQDCLFAFSKGQTRLPIPSQFLPCHGNGIRPLHRITRAMSDHNSGNAIFESL